MNDLLLIVLVLGGGVAFVAGIAYLLQHRAQAEGSLFTAAASPTARVLALVIGALFTAFFFLEISFMGMFHVVIPILAVAPLAYGLGAGCVLASIQRQTEEQAPESGQDENQDRK